jgi:dTDP-4-amino-4,6-dideoxygalactose transaminase
MSAHDAPVRVHKGHDHVDDEMKRAAIATIDSKRYYMGPENDAFEAEMQTALGIQHAATVNSGSSGMFLILRALKIGPGDEVIVPASGFVTLAEAVATVGARARFADIEDETYNFDPAALEKALTPKTKAIVPHHNYGHPADMDAVMAFAKKHNLFVIEDCCHALGSRWRGTSGGGIGHAGFTSFAGKSISVCGLGGMVLTNDPKINEEVRLLRDHGRPRSGGKRFYEITRVGYNLRLSELHAAIGRVQLRHLEAWNERRRANSEGLTLRLNEAKVPVTCPVTRPGAVHAFLHYTVRVPADARDGLKAHLEEKGVETSIMYPTELYLLPPYREVWGGKPGEFPVADRVNREILTLPNNPSLTESDLDYVADSIRGFFRGK